MYGPHARARSADSRGVQEVLVSVRPQNLRRIRRRALWRSDARARARVRRAGGDAGPAGGFARAGAAEPGVHQVFGAGRGRPDAGHGLRAADSGRAAALPDPGAGAVDLVLHRHLAQISPEPRRHLPQGPRADQHWGHGDSDGLQEHHAGDQGAGRRRGEVGRLSAHLERRAARGGQDAGVQRDQGGVQPGGGRALEPGHQGGHPARGQDAVGADAGVGQVPLGRPPACVLHRRGRAGARHRRHHPCDQLRLSRGQRRGRGLRAPHRPDGPGRQDGPRPHLLPRRGQGPRRGAGQRAERGRPTRPARPRGLRDPHQEEGGQDLRCLLQGRGHVQKGHKNHFR
mmetsp:Transcript_20146/g.45652  ORF Transcript_20146/g.45652 Transcript_20146/m.45652 type:complete len:342 (+) Transcript_20146:479-1504(+)